MPETVSELRCAECLPGIDTVPTVVRTPGGSDRLVVVCVVCGWTQDHGPIDSEAVA